MYTFTLNEIEYNIDDNTVIGLRMNDTDQYYDKVKPYYNKSTWRLSFISIVKKSIFKPDEYVTYLSPDDLIGWFSTIDILESHEWIIWFD
jgi:hypothetical protein